MPVELSIAHGVAEIVLNDPAKLNALDEGAIAALSSALTSAEQAGVRALLLRGEGRAFCAGRDISGVDPATDDARGYLDDIIDPRDTRPMLIDALETLQNKRDRNPPKKHGNIPL